MAAKKKSRAALGHTAKTARMPTRATVKKARLSPTRRQTKPKSSRGRTAKRGAAKKTTPRERAKQRALDALSRMRHGKSLSRAAKLAHTTAATVRKYAAGGVQREHTGIYAPKSYDRIARQMRFLTPEGVIAVSVRSSAAASRLGEYWNAVDRYLRMGRREALRPFQGRRLRVGSRVFAFVTDPLTLDRLANAGEVRFEDLYALTG